jgi:hypothetical protein
VSRQEAFLPASGVPPGRLQATTHLNIEETFGVLASTINGVCNTTPSLDANLHISSNLVYPNAKHVANCTGFLDAAAVKSDDYILSAVFPVDETCSEIFTVACIYDN